MLNSKPRRPRVRVAVFACIAIVALGADQLSKYLAQTYLTETDYIQVIPRFLHLTLIIIPGPRWAWGPTRPG